MTAIKRSETITASTSLVTTDTAQTVPGVKTFSNGIKLGNNETLSVYDEATWTPTVASYGGSITVASISGATTRIGRAVLFRCQFTISNSTSGSGVITVTLPDQYNNPPAFLSSASGIERADTNKALSIDITTAIMSIAFYDGTSCLGTATSRTYVISGTYFV